MFTIIQPSFVICLLQSELNFLQVTVFLLWQLVVALNGLESVEFEKAYHKVIWRVWHQPFTTHNVPLPLFAGGKSLKDLLQQSFVKFSCHCIYAAKKLVHS